MKRLSRYWWVAGLLLALALALFAPLASRSPDGLERVAEDTGFAADADGAPFEVMPDYQVRWLGDGAASQIVAGAAGAAAVFGVVYLLSRFMRRRRDTPESADRGRHTGQQPGE